MHRKTNMCATTLASMGTTARSAASASSNVWNKQRCEICSNYFLTDWDLSKAEKFLKILLQFNAFVYKNLIKNFPPFFFWPSDGLLVIHSTENSLILTISTCILTKRRPKTKSGGEPVAKTLPSQCWCHATSRALPVKLMCSKPEKARLQIDLKYGLGFLT